MSDIDGENFNATISGGSSRALDGSVGGQFIIPPHPQESRSYVFFDGHAASHQVNPDDLPANP